MAPLIVHILAFLSILAVPEIMDASQEPALAIFGAALGILGGVAKRLVTKAAGHPARRARAAARSRGAAAAGGAAAGMLLPAPPLPGRGPVRRPRGRTARRIAGALPGGRGFTEQIGDVTVRDKRFGFERPLMMEPEFVERIAPPRGYVAVDLDGDGQNDAVMLKEAARALKMWRGRPKPPIKASDWRKLKAAARVQKKAKKIAKTAGFTCKKR